MTDSRLLVTDEPRRLVQGVTAETPLATIMWRALRADHQRLVKERQSMETDAKRLRNILAGVAEEAYRLRRTVNSARAALDQAGREGEAQQLLSISRQLEAALSELEVTIVAPEGEPYTGELMELLDNVAQQTSAEAEGPRVAEVIKPAVTYRGALLRMGKAIIAIPARREPAETITAALNPGEVSPEELAADEQKTQEAASISKSMD